LIGTNVRFLANEERVYTYSFDQYNAPARTGIARNELVRGGGELRRYFNNDQKFLSVHVQQGDREISLFNERETLHMKDVKAVFQFVNHLQEIALVYIMTYVVGVFVWARERPLQKLAVHSLSGGLLTIGIIVSLGLVAISGFDQTFEQFHHIAFSNDLWLLDPATDHLVQMFPEGFWFDVTMFLGILTLAEATLITTASTVHLTISRRAAKHALLPSQQGAH
ncbi:MAG TPA: TIGR01906 family membrane protein, partial [Dehalococcoidia bacterium]|nr:TIGR01906 family membrane protein [Dehalococcoidia bacterium]